MAIERRRLNDEEIASALTELNGWSIEDGMLAKSFSFPAYKDGLAFAAAVGFLADAMDHHPDIFIGYRKASVKLSTHDVGGISPWDFALAKKIDALG